MEVAYVSEQRGDESRVREALSSYDAFREIADRLVEATRDTFDYGNKLDKRDVELFLAEIGV